MVTELGLADTNGILSLPWIDPVRTSAGLGWERLYVSTQAELPYRSSFCSARTHQLILHLDGPVTVRRGHGGLGSPRRVPPGGLFLHPAARDLTVELGGDLQTVHVYLADEAVQEAAGCKGRVELAEEQLSVCSAPVAVKAAAGLPSAAPWPAVGCCWPRFGRATPRAAAWPMRPDMNWGRAEGRCRRPQSDRSREAAPTTRPPPSAPPLRRDP